MLNNIINEDISSPKPCLTENVIDNIPLIKTLFIVSKQYAYELTCKSNPIRNKRGLPALKSSDRKKRFLRLRNVQAHQF